MDASLPDWRRHKPVGGTTPGARSVGSLGSPVASTTSQQAAVAGSGGSGELPGSSAALRTHRRRSSQSGEATPAVSHFSIAAVLEPGSAGVRPTVPTPVAKQPLQQVPMAAAKPAAAAALQQQQQQQRRQVSLEADATQAALERSGGKASTSGRPASGDSEGQLVPLRTRMAGMSLHDAGTGSVPLEESSPLRSGRNRSYGSAPPLQQPREQLGRGSQQPQPQPQDQLQPQPQQEPASADDHHARGYALRKAGDFAGAVREYSAALALNPTHFKALFNRAFSRDKLGQYAAALADYEAALRLDPTSSYAHYNAGIVRDRLGQYGAAVACFTAAIQLEPDNADFYHVRGGGSERRGHGSDTMLRRCGHLGPGVAGFSAPHRCPATAAAAEPRLLVPAQDGV